MQKFWGILFGTVLLASFVLWAVAPFMGWWLPKNVASFGGDVDYLFYLITWLTAFFFLLTEVILVYTMCRFTHQPGRKSQYIHGNHTLEMVWTVVPAGILLFIAFTQINAWERIKYQAMMPTPSQVIQVTARQWEWRVRYPADVNLTEERARAWAESPEADDIRGVNEIHVWAGEDAHVKLYLKTQDVIHSLYFPNLRLKQDALPGKTIPMWFRIVKSNTKWNVETKKCEEAKDPEDRWEIACAELCGSRHYAMRGRLYVHPNIGDFKLWLEYAKAQQNSHAPEENRPIPGSEGEAK